MHPGPSEAETDEPLELEDYFLPHQSAPDSVRDPASKYQVEDDRGGRCSELTSGLHAVRHTNEDIIMCIL